MKIDYQKGDATKPILEPNSYNFIVHSCNNEGVWGAGFVIAINKLSKLPYEEYAKLKPNELELGFIQRVKIPASDVKRHIPNADGIETSLEVVNIIAQDGFSTSNQRIPFSFDGFRTGLLALLKQIDAEKLDPVSFHLPMVGSGIGGAKWEDVEALINEVLEPTPFKVVVYVFG